MQVSKWKSFISGFLWQTKYRALDELLFCHHIHYQNIIFMEAFQYFFFINIYFIWSNNFPQKLLTDCFSFQRKSSLWSCPTIPFSPNNWPIQIWTYWSWCSLWGGMQERFFSSSVKVIIIQSKIFTLTLTYSLCLQSEVSNYIPLH